MRKLTDEAVDAFINHRHFKKSNTEVHAYYEGNGATMELFGHTIARHDQDGLEITNAGWSTATTKERLNGIQGVWIRQSKGVWYLNGRQWSGNWTNVQKWDDETLTLNQK